jgi:hypothetical protein
MPLRDIRQLIGASAELDTVRKNAQRLTALQKAFVDYTPVELAELTRASRVGYIKAGTLYLWADHAAVAAKLRQLLPRLLPRFSKLDAEITGIKVVVQVQFPPHQSWKNAQKNQLPIDSIEHFERLSRAVKDPALKSAIANLVRKRPKPKA